MPFCGVRTGRRPAVLPKRYHTQRLRQCGEIVQRQSHVRVVRLKEPFQDAQGALLELLGLRVPAGVVGNRRRLLQVMATS